MPVLDRPLLAWHLDAIAKEGIRDVVVVIGHHGERIVETIGDGSDRGLRITYVEQPDPHGIAHALACAEEAVRLPFVLMLGDVFFGGDELGGLLTRLGEPDTDAVLAIQYEADPDRIRKNYSVEMDADERVTRVVEKPPEPASSWRGTGLYGFSLGFFDAVRRTEPSPLRGECELTDAIQLYIEAGARVLTVESDAPDFNLSDTKDLLELNLYALDRIGLTNFVAPTARTDGAQLERSVVLAGASIDPAARLEACLVFPGEQVPEGSYRRAILAGGDVLDCSP